MKAFRFTIGPRHAPIEEGGTGVPPVKDTGEATSPTPYFEELQDIKIRHRNLPHWQQDGKYYFVTWRLADSLPAQLVRDWKSEADSWLSARHQPTSAEDEKEFHKLFSNRVEAFLDEGLGECILVDPAIVKIVHNALLHFHGFRYDLLAHVVMPNHVHVLFRLEEGHDLGKTIHSWKSFTAHKINKVLGRDGTLWQDEYHDRIVRGEEHLHRLVDYILENPKKAGVKNACIYTAGTAPPSRDPAWNSAGRLKEGGTGVPPVNVTGVETPPVPFPPLAPTRAGRPCPSLTPPSRHAD